MAWTRRHLPTVTLMLLSGLTAFRPLHADAPNAGHDAGGSPPVASQAVIAPPKQDLPLASLAAIAVDLADGAVLVAKNPDVALPVASITKLMTTLVVMESGVDLSEWVTIQDWDTDLAKNAYSRIRPTSEARRRDLMRIALMSSENRAAYNLGVHHPGGAEALITAMNARAAELGMQASEFVDATGLSTANRSSAADLALLLAAAHRHPELRDFSTTRAFTVQFRAPRYQLGYGNTNPLTGSGRWEVSLTKTGYLTEAGRCLAMVSSVNGREVALVMLNSFGKRTPLGDAGRIRRWLESGTAGQVAPAARAYEQKMVTHYGLD